jgi:preprotein translocase subunit SecE
MKTIAITSGILYVLATIIGAVLQLMHWPYGVIIQNTGFSLLLFVFIPSLIFYIVKMKRKIHRKF